MRSQALFVVIHILLHVRIILARHDHNYLAHHYQHYHQYQTHEPPTDLSIWISEQQVKVLSGYSLRIFAIENGRVSHFLRDPAFDSYLPMIPPEVSYVNFTWTSGQKKYRYHFDQLTSLNEEILQPPIISIKPKGKIPQEPKRKIRQIPKKTTFYHFFGFRIQRHASLLQPNVGHCQVQSRTADNERPRPPLARHSATLYSKKRMLAQRYEFFY